MIPADLYRYTPEQRQALADDPTTSPELLLARSLGKRLRAIERERA